MMPVVPLELLKKYDKAGPRYTSYPTAPHFQKSMDLEAVHEQISSALQSNDLQPLSLYFHVPFCKAVCLYCGCHTSACSDVNRISRYMQTMMRELENFAKKYKSNRPVKQIHFGGGTPTHAGLEALRSVLMRVRQLFNVAADAEVALELDPRQISGSDLAELRGMGFNRVSFGIQDLDVQVQRAIARVQSPDMCASVVRMAREEGFESVNTDLIYGLPYQTLESQRRTLDFVIEKMRPDRLALFNFAYIPTLKPHQKAINATEMPSPEAKLAMLKQGIETLVAGGYEFIGMDHFALSQDSLARALRNGKLNRNFQGYTTMAGVDILAFGASSISQFANAYMQNVKDENLYVELVDAGQAPYEKGIVLTPDDVLRRDVIMQILCTGVLDKQDVEQRYKISFDEYFEEALGKTHELQCDGLVEVASQKLVVTPLGRMFVRNLAMLFDARLDGVAQGAKPQYSRTV